MTSFKELVRESDVVLEVIDARFPEMRSKELEDLVDRHYKRLIVVVNKIDLVDELPKVNRPHVYLSCKLRKGKQELMDKIRTGRVAVVGYPNVGKSSIINYLTHRHSARVAPTAGQTKGRQFIRTKGILFYDTPGVVPLPTGRESLVLIGAANPEDIEDLEGVAAKIIRKLDPRQVSTFYKTEESTDPQTVLERLAQRRGKLLKGRKTDKNAAAKILIRDWQRGALWQNSRASKGQE